MKVLYCALTILVFLGIVLYATKEADKHNSAMLFFEIVSVPIFLYYLCVRNYKSK